jgi:hypothetical protein
LPLSFFAKSLHHDSGFLSQESAVHYAFVAAFCALPYFGMLWATIGQHRSVSSRAMILTSVATVLYLLTVRQIMGGHGRFYVPYLPFIAVPAILSFDAALNSDPRRAVERTAWVIGAALLAFAVTIPLQHLLERAYVRLVVPAPIQGSSFALRTSNPIPGTEWFPTIQSVAQLIAHLPAEATVAASEVGYLGYASPDRYILDLAGLNDTRIALHGFSMDYLLQKSPDFIWLPHTDYSGLRALMFSDQRFFDRYFVVAGAFNYGIAIRRNSPYRKDIERELSVIWESTYPNLPMADFIVQSASTS